MFLIISYYIKLNYAIFYLKLSYEEVEEWGEEKGINVF